MKEQTALGEQQQQQLEDEDTRGGDSGGNGGGGGGRYSHQPNKANKRFSQLIKTQDNRVQLQQRRETAAAAVEFENGERIQEVANTTSKKQYFNETNTMFANF